ncbi:MAG: HlyD family secretion protein [Eubacteriales bacterium]
MEKEIKQLVEKNKLGSTILIGVVVAVFILAGIFIYSADAEKEEEQIVQGSIETEVTDLNSKIAGNVATVFVKEGDNVKKGDVLIQIDSTTLEAKLSQAKGAQAAAQAQATKARNGARSEEVAKAKAAYDYAQKSYDRMKNLLAEEAISQATFDQVEAQYIAAKETYDMATEGARYEDVNAANAMVQQATGAVSEVNGYLEDAKIKAPKDGVVTAVNVSEGELISTGMPLITVTANIDPWVSFDIPETELDKLKQGQKLDLKIPAYGDSVFEGTVTNISEKPGFAVKKATNKNGDFDIVSYSVKVEIKPSKHKLYSGMTVLLDLSDKALKAGGK